MTRMTEKSDYSPPKVWIWDKEKDNAGRFSAINRPTAGSTHDKQLPVGKHPHQLYSLATPNGVKVTVMFEELLALGKENAEYDAAKEAHHRLFDATEVALEILKPGITAIDLFSVMDHILRPDQSAQLGGDEVGRYGHGLGIQLTEPPSHTNWDKTVIKAGMALTIEPSISYGDGQTMVAEENVLILDDGIVLLSERAPRDLPIIFVP